MAEYIKREAVFTAIQRKMQEYINKAYQPLGFARYREDADFSNAALGCRAAFEEVKSIPAADVVPIRHGQWIEKPYLLGVSRFCSLCGSNYGMPHEVYNYCPNCGALMDKEAGDGAD